jgi:hypothetical protein
MIGISCEDGNEPPGSCKSASSILPEKTLASGRSLLRGVSFWSLYLLSEECLLIRDSNNVGVYDIALQADDRCKSVVQSVQAMYI